MDSHQDGSLFPGLVLTYEFPLSAQKQHSTKLDIYIPVKQECITYGDVVRFFGRHEDEKRKMENTPVDGLWWINQKQSTTIRLRIVTVPEKGECLNDIFLEQIFR